MYVLFGHLQKSPACRGRGGFVILDSRTMDSDVGQNIHILSRRASNSSFARCNGRTTKAGDTGLDGGHEPWTETLRMVFRTVSEQVRGPAGHSQAGQDTTDPSPNHGSLYRPGSHTARGGRLPQEQKRPLGGARVGPSTSVSQRCMFVHYSSSLNGPFRCTTSGTDPGRREPGRRRSSRLPNT